MKCVIIVVPFFTMLTLRSTFISADDRFIKRYALMKMYESCFGPEAVKEIRKEMKIALAKCTGAMPSATTYSSNLGSNTFKTPVKTSTFQNKQSTGGTDGTYSAEHLKSHSNSHIDLSKLQQAILAGYNKQPTLQQQQSSAYSNNVAMNGVLAGFSHVRPWNYAVPMNALPYSFSNGLLSIQPSPFTLMPLNYQISPFYQPAIFPSYNGVGRSSRDLDVKGQLESLAVRINGRIRNITCIMQELGYLNGNLEPDYEKIISRVKKLSITDDLKKEMAAGVDYCKQFSLCVPDDSKDKYAKDMIKPMFFFRCYKHKKMEACILKDIRERYTADDISENFIATDRSDRNSRGINNNYLTELALYEFLYGADMDVEDIL